MYFLGNSGFYTKMLWVEEIRRVYFSVTKVKGLDFILKGRGYIIKLPFLTN